MNVLFITADQWRGDCLSKVGHPAVKTPSLDRLADDGVLFARHFSNMTPCGPSRASLHTGMYGFNHRSIRNGTPLDARHTTLAQELRKAGLDPVLFGYTDTSIDPRGVAATDPRLLSYEGVAPGYRPICLMLEAAAPWLAHLRGRGYGNLQIEDVYAGELGAPAMFGAEDSETAFLTDQAIAYLDRRRPHPFFLHLSYIKPHPPFVAAAPWNASVDPRDLPPLLRQPTIQREGELHPWLAAHLQRPLGSWFKEHFAGSADLEGSRLTALRQVYGGLIEEVDHHVGRLVDHLARTDQLDDTLIVFTADHGEMAGDHWMIGKSGFFPQAFHVPLIIRHPRGARELRVERFTEHVDLMPTFLEAAGLPVLLQCDGHALTPFLKGEQPGRWRDAVHYEHDVGDLETGWHRTALGLDDHACGLATIFDGHHALVQFSGLPPLLFDHARDPAWLSDLSTNPSYALTRADLAGSMLSWRMRYADRRLSSALLTPSGPVGRFE
ncbi:MAG TPA: alkaline phosphatase family protein [Geminicoccus sp.]|uniref:alkaline phosphatase family protein n=1 Tax=Geminicoccus sp. TaxID=2024832 RepID=UPI002E373E3F|nr:alkaline phosphatase family protein [Geminicoccus sp.]HEX2527081.1 alkaline phosphatase family protein [Geminicoccus sp.]